VYPVRAASETVSLGVADHIGVADSQVN
jgi:hypothetical protein